MGFYPAFSAWYVNQSTLNACTWVHICMQSTYLSPFLTEVCTNRLYPPQVLRFLLFLSRGPGKAAQGERLLLFKCCIPASWDAGLRRRQSPACSRRVIAFWKWAAALRASVPSKCSFQSPSAGRMEQGSSAPQPGWAGPRAGGPWVELGKPWPCRGGWTTTILSKLQQGSADKTLSTFHLITSQSFKGLVCTSGCKGAAAVQCWQVRLG